MVISRMSFNGELLGYLWKKNIIKTLGFRSGSLFSGEPMWRISERPNIWV